MVQTGDLLVIERGGVTYRTTAADLLNFLTDNIGTTERLVADITERDALTDLSIGDRVEVTDASADVTVDSGWAIYSKTAIGFKKVGEEEGLDIIVGNSDLSVVRTSTNVTIANTNGTDATVASADATNAGMMTSADFVKLGFVTVTGAVDLDNVANLAHNAVTTDGTGLTNPVTVDGNQVVGFSISGLSPAP